MCDLAVQVGRLDDVAVDDAQGAYSGAGNVCRCWAAEATCSDDEDLRGLEPLLAYGGTISKTIPTLGTRIV